LVREAGERLRESDYEVIGKKKPIQIEESIIINGRIHSWGASKFPLFDTRNRLHAAVRFR
jgi:hypothetical protein